MQNRSTSGADLEAARQRWPGWQIDEVFGGFEAVRAGEPVFRGMFLSSLEEQLADREPQGGCAERAAAALAELSAQEHDFSGALAAALIEAERRRGGWHALERRAGSWEAALTARLLDGTDGGDRGEG